MAGHVDDNGGIAGARRELLRTLVQCRRHAPGRELQGHTHGGDDGRGGRRGREAEKTARTAPESSSGTPRSLPGALRAVSRSASVSAGLTMPSSSTGTALMLGVLVAMKGCVGATAGDVWWRNDDDVGEDADVSVDVGGLAVVAVAVAVAGSGDTGMLCWGSEPDAEAAVGAVLVARCGGRELAMVRLAQMRRRGGAERSSEQRENVCSEGEHSAGHANVNSAGQCMHGHLQPSIAWRAGE